VDGDDLDEDDDQEEGKLLQEIHTVTKSMLNRI